MTYKLGGLIPLETFAMKQPKELRYNAFMRQATLHSVIADLEKIRFMNKVDTFIQSLDTWITTDNLGSGYDTRYTNISWMDTR